MSHAGTESERLVAANIQSKLAIMNANDFVVFSPGWRFWPAPGSAWALPIQTFGAAGNVIAIRGTNEQAVLHRSTHGACSDGMSARARGYGHKVTFDRYGRRIEL